MKISFEKDAEVIILDEPSRSIDPLAEAEIFEHFKTLAKDKVLILVTHRLYNLKMADMIVVLHEGAIVESGNHKELIKVEGRYKAMFEKQAKPSIAFFASNKEKMTAQNLGSLFISCSLN